MENFRLRYMIAIELQVVYTSVFYFLIGVLAAKNISLLRSNNGFLQVS
jgi:hypothetical protein